ncbi:hypothetical protein IMZ08_15310 [Bacillus luteolus]|uniref:Uncharacterized protein n=1 Tax=Litchfieldia luteola TaxID=682179 RepID=A0ABR9QMM2_9BACI|nr:hypothetical protein [Cytobacillus luteolus]MBE4909419.1 hypothetical protein [Cytobacillus luteolus]MBP1940819.1 hypothetical protein [Cytobacillus luteolus]
MSDHNFNRHTCSCQSSAHSHPKHCGCQMKHTHHHDFCSSSSSSHHQSIHHDTCRCNRVDRFPRNRFRRQDHQNNFNRRNRLSRLTPLHHHRHGDDCVSHDHETHLHGKNHSINEMIRLHKGDDGKKNIVIIM